MNDDPLPDDHTGDGELQEHVGWLNQLPWDPWWIELGIAVLVVVVISLLL